MSGSFMSSSCQCPPRPTVGVSGNPGLADRELPWQRQLRLQTNLQTLGPSLANILSPLDPELARKKETKRWKKKRRGHLCSCPRQSCELVVRPGAAGVAGAREGERLRRSGE